jgi:hypothetical protein
MAEVSNRDAQWAEARVRELLRDCVSWLVLCALAELGVVPEP